MVWHVSHASLSFPCGRTVDRVVATPHPGHSHTRGAPSTTGCIGTAAIPYVQSLNVLGAHSVNEFITTRREARRTNTPPLSSLALHSREAAIAPIRKRISGRAGVIRTQSRVLPPGSTPRMPKSRPGTAWFQEAIRSYDTDRLEGLCGEGLRPHSCASSLTRASSCEVLGVNKSRSGQSV